jgi:hypothetical protein
MGKKSDDQSTPPSVPVIPPPPLLPAEARAPEAVLPPAEKKPSRGLGYRKDKPEVRAKQPRFRDKLRAQLPNGFRAVLPKSVTLRSRECPRMDQGQFGSCTGHGTAQGLAVSCAVAGIKLGFVPSPRGVYANARCMELSDPSQPLTDSGSEPADVMTVLQTLGVRAIQAPTDDGRYSDVDDTNVNAKPTLLELEAEVVHLVVGEYRIDEKSADAPQQVAAAIAGLHGGPSCAVGIGVFVDTAFMNWTPKGGPLDAPPNQNDPNGGGHWVAIVGFATAADGTLVFDVVNSWGDMWGDGTGHIQVTQKWLMAAVSDIYVLTAQIAPPAAEKVA